MNMYTKSYGHMSINMGGINKSKNVGKLFLQHIKVLNDLYWYIYAKT